MNDRNTESEYNVGPDDYSGHLSLAEKHNLNLWENHGWGIRSLQGEGDSLLWVAAYQLRSRPGGPFIKEKFSALQSMVTHVEYTRAQRREMHDNDFAAIGWNGPDDLRSPEALAIRVDAREAVWSIDDMRFTAAPPVWKIEGVQRDIGYDIVLEADEPAFWLTDRTKTALESGDRWHLVNARANGSVKLEGRTIALSGMGWHERHIHLNDAYDPAVLLKGAGIIFHNGYSRDVNIHLMGRPQLGIMRAKVVHDAISYDFEGKKFVSVETLQVWSDPRTRMTIPFAWLVRMDDGKASLELHVQAFARTFYLWNFLSGGVNILHWWIAEANGVFTPPGRCSVEIADMKHVVHQNQTFYTYV